MSTIKSGGRYIRQAPGAKPVLEHRTKPSDGKLRDAKGKPLKAENPPEPKQAPPAASVTQATKPAAKKEAKADD